MLRKRRSFFDFGLVNNRCFNQFPGNMADEPFGIPNKKAVAA